MSIGGATVFGQSDKHAQDPSLYSGKIIRLRDDGSVPADNPFVGRAGYKPEIYSLGHRNMLGLFVHPETGELWENENGPLGGDELNIIRAGKNYGWPLVTYGRQYSGPRVSKKTQMEGMEDPLVFWVPSIAPLGHHHLLRARSSRSGRATSFVGSLRVGEITVTGHLERVVRDRARRSAAARDAAASTSSSACATCSQSPDGFPLRAHRRKRLGADSARAGAVNSRFRRPRLTQARMDKTVPDLATAVLGIETGMTLMVGGFGGSGAPIELIHALIDRFRATGSPGNLTVINNNAGNGRIGLAAMIDHGMVAKMICSFPRSADPRAFTEKYLAGQIELELVPQGTLAERIRAGGAGIPAFYTPTSYGTDVAKGKPVAEFDGKHYVQERWLKADAALIKAETRRPATATSPTARPARNFSPLMAWRPPSSPSSQATRIVEPGEIDPEIVVTPGIFVDRIVAVPDRAGRKKS